MPSFAELLAPIRRPEPREPVDEPTARFHEWLRSNASPELAAWNATLAATSVRGGYRNELFAGTCPTLAEVLAVPDDGCHAARIRSVFCGVSAILEDAEELWLASWGSTAGGTSVVFASHQDERDLWAAAPSLADFLLSQYQEDSYFQKDLEVPEAIAKLPVRSGGAPLPAGFDPLILTERVHWIVALLFPEGDWYGLGNGLVRAPAYATFAEEEEALASTPHLLAYWLLHHAVFDNREAFARLVPIGEASAYPPARELASSERGAWWNEAAVARLRAEALRDRPEVFEPAAIEATSAVRAKREELTAAIRTKLGAFAGTAGAQLVAAVLDGVTLATIDVEVIRDLRDPEDPDSAERDLDARLLAKRGDAPGLGVLFEQVTSEVDASWDPIAADLAALVATGGASEDLAAIDILVGRRFDASPGEGHRLGRLARAAVALERGTPEALAFAREEATRFFETLPRSTTDTAALAAVGLLRRRDTATIEALAAALRKNPAHAGTGRALVGLMGPDPAFAAPLEAIVANGHGRAAEGEPVLWAALLGRAAPERALALAAPTLDATPERRAAILAGRLVARPDEEHRSAALALLGELDPKKERAAAAALALLRAAHEAGIEGFAAAAATWRAAKRSKHVGAPLARWFEKTATAIR